MKQIDITEDLAINFHQDDIKNLFNEYYPRLVYFCYQILNNKHQAEDVVQDAFIKFWDQSKNISNHPIAIKNFLYSTVKNASLNIIRHNKVTEKHISNNQTVPIEEAVINSIVKSEILAEINAAIDKLPASCGQIFKMSYFEELKNEQIASILGISINTVKTQKQRALKSLRLSLKPNAFILLLSIQPHLKNIFF